MATVVELEKIELDPTAQPRVNINMEIVDEYAAEMKAGADFPPVEVVWNSETDKYWLWDGFHRVMAARQVGQLWLMANVATGSREDAQWKAYSANAAHGLRRTNADKRRVVELALLHRNGAEHSNRQIARHCGVSLSLVNIVRKDLEASEQIVQMETRTVQRGDQVYEMDVSNIGRRADIELSAEAVEPAGRTQVQTSSISPETRLAERHSVLMDVSDHSTIRPMPGWQDRTGTGLNDSKSRDRNNGRRSQVNTDPVPDAPATFTPIRRGEEDNGYTTFEGAEGTYIAPEIVEAMVICLGKIDLDPCAGRHSGAEIPAGESLGPDIDGLTCEWNGRIGLTPPYGHMIRYWISRLCEEYSAGRTVAAVAIVPARTDDRWWTEIADYAAAVCFIEEQYKSVKSGLSSAQPLAAFYVGRDSGAFSQAFAPLGNVWGRVGLPEKAIGQ